MSTVAETPEELASSPFAAGHEFPVVQAQAAPYNREMARSVHWAILSLCLAVVAAAALMDTSGERQVVLPVLNRPLPELCYSRRMFGIDCPGCGLTRCFVSMAHLRFDRAWRFSPAGMLLFVGVAFQIPYRFWQLRRIDRGLPEWEIVGFPYVLVGMCVLLMAQWVLRMAF